MKFKITALIIIISVWGLTACENMQITPKGSESDVLGEPLVTLEYPEPPLPGNPEPPDMYENKPPLEVWIKYDEDGASIITEEETELTSELKRIVNMFYFTLIPEDNESEIIINARNLINFNNFYIREGKLEPLAPTEEDVIQIHQKYGADHVLKVENLDFIFNYLFSKEAVQFKPGYSDYADDDGIISIGAFGITSGYTLILKEQTIGEEVVDLYFYYFYLNGENIYLKSPAHYEPAATPTDITENNPVIGHSGYYEGGDFSYYSFNDGVFETLGVVKYTFIPEDGKYKILSIELIN
ncbi:MAG: hypothetical protein FWH08_00970 [Oscillospiraceae bacterium]|nr:hypothetical protein [Oscillospiraceae bacterium]